MSGSDDSSGHLMLQGTPEQRIQSFLDIEYNENGHAKAGDWMNSLMPHVKLHSTCKDTPHPRVTFTYTVQPDHCNRLQNLHGGCAATLFDFCTTMPLSLINKPGYWAYLGVTRTLSVTYLRPVPVGMEVLIECEVIHAGKNLATMKGVMKRKSDGAILCMAEHGKASIEPKL